MSDSDYKYDSHASFLKMDPYYISLDKRWKLDELSDFSKNYEQSYYAAFALEALSSKSKLPADIKSRILIQMSRYPWKGGYSTVQFYFGVKRIVGRRRQPEIQRIQYASPGFIELSAIQDIALNLGAIVGSVCGSITVINATYNRIYKGLRERQLNEIAVERSQLELGREQREFLLESIGEMGQHLNLDEQAELIRASGNEFRALKILLSMYRRVRAVTHYQEEQKIHLPTSKDEK